MAEKALLARFETFRWPLPLAFASAVAASRFERGDVLYSDEGMYGPVSGAPPEGVMAIQVLEPPRSVRGIPLESERDRRRSNWESPVVIDLIDLASGSSQQRSLTQGKLIMALWKGDSGWLSAEHPEPEFPTGARELHAELEQALPALDAPGAPVESRPGSRFLLVVDLAADASRSKAALVAERLHSGGEVEIADVSPADAGLDEADRYHPTLVLRVFSLPGRAPDDIEVLLRGCLYRGGSGVDPDPPGGEAAADRFSVGRHGLLVEIGRRAS